MRYVNLKKRNTSKFNYVSKKVATLSLLSLAFLSVIVVPLTMKSDKEDAFKGNPIAIEVEDLGNDYIEAFDLEDSNETDM